MLKKRLIGVITVLNGKAVQSFGYKSYLPLGSADIIAENLDRWGADEILLQCIDRSEGARGPDFDLLERIAKKGIGTPLIYGGGIRTIQDGVDAVSLGADRILIDTLMHEDLNTVKALSCRLGSQAIIAALPLSLEDGNLRWLNYHSMINHSISSDVIRLIENEVVSEVLVIDWKNEGMINGFNLDLIEFFPCARTRLIAFGGISEPTQLIKLLGSSRVDAVGIGNFLNYREHAISSFRKMTSESPIEKTLRTF